ncbi:hypothetical protein D9756_011569 [Leucocoprinus leucothites]|uniref:Uncharacterized protein n=1 Tax=Leucocoprinus leucothites TaxID=201217 RepID=A0A8H5CN71_9AGAR|nr:hypothetical protein D9756_011569 [Leucoagaricus leucothites]
MIMVILDVPHSRLERLEVAISQPDDHANHFPETIKVVHQRLRHLSITNDYDFSMSPLPIISALTAPNLEYLDVGEMHDEGHTAVFLHELFAFLSRSGCTLRTMRGLPISRHMSEAQLHQLLALPQLRKVRELRVLNATAAFHRLLTAPALPIPPSNRTSFLQCYGAPSVLPRIEDLELHRMPVCHREFSDMVLSRMQTLKKVEVKGGVALAVLPLSQRLLEHPDLTVEYITSTDRGDGGDELPLWADRIRTKTRDHSASFESDRCQDAVIQHRAGSRRPHCSHDPIFHGIRCQGCRDGDCYYTHGVGDTSDL